MQDLKYQLLKTSTQPNGQVKGRYAPSPSGVQHLGNIQTALVAWLQTRLAGGEFILRMDDIDTPRLIEGSAEQIIDDLRWLGMDWDSISSSSYLPYEDGVYYQSQQQLSYLAALKSLDEQSRLFTCSCSRKDIQQLVKKPSIAGHFVYPGTCRTRQDSYDNTAKDIAWRFRVSDKIICFKDQLMGDQCQNIAIEMGDLIVKRRDGLFAYQLASVVDDIQMGITDVVRGADLLGSTPAQIDLFECLGAPVPRFWHLALKLDAKGDKLSKRSGSVSLQMLRQQGATAEQIIGQLAWDLKLVENDAPIKIQQLLKTLRVQQ